MAELNYFKRSTLMWFVMALFGFVSAWSLLMTMEVFANVQVKFAGMSDAPTLYQGIIYPVIAMQAKLMILLVSIVAGLSYSRLGQYNAWSLLLTAHCSEFLIVQHKYWATVLVACFFVLPLFLALMCLSFFAKMAVLPVLVSLFGLSLLILWMLALCHYLSSLVTNAGFAVLLCAMVLMLFLMLSQSASSASWGKNWLQVFSPFYHFQRFNSDTFSLVSVFYFVSNISLFLWLTTIRLRHKRYSL